MFAYICLADAEPYVMTAVCAAAKPKPCIIIFALQPFIVLLKLMCWGVAASLASFKEGCVSICGAKFSLKLISGLI